MNTRDPQALIEKLKRLPPERVAEVDDFVDFLRTRDEERALERAAARTAEPAFAKVWNNDDDAAPKALPSRPRARSKRSPGR